jgi:S-DNA-T family DNA segregation ATPase FtsK/SpoIIIE
LKNNAPPIATADGLLVAFARRCRVVTDEELRQNGAKLIETLASFGVKAKILMINRGPSVTRYELQPEPGVRINAITKLSDDIALRLAASSVRIEAPIPNKSAIGVEVPNKSRASVPIRDIIDTVQFRTAKSKLNVAIGKDITGNVVCADLVRMPHLLIAGTTGSGKSVCLNSMIVSLLFNATPDEVRLLLIDPKAVELAPYNGIAHLEVPVVSDPRKAAGALSWAVTEMQNRYKLFTEHNARILTLTTRLPTSRSL